MGESTNAKRKVLRWKRQPRERGLAAVAQGERGWELWYGNERIGTVAARDRRDASQGYYWYAGADELGVPAINTFRRQPQTADEAKALCRAHVEEYLKRG